MDLALEEAQVALEEGEVPVGCVVVMEGEVVGRGHNCTNKWRDPLAHAEIVALRDVVKKNVDLTNVIFYITVEPCVMCNGILKRVGVSVKFGCFNEIFGTKKLTGERAGECLNDERCVRILQEFYEGENGRAPPLKRKTK